MGITVIAKPTHDCNLACKYCYLPPSAENGMMTEEILKRTYQQTVEMSRGEAHFIWHGGEPLMAGMEFYKLAADLSRFYRSKGNRISNGVQTNGTLVNEELLDFIEREGDFRLGMSLDGPKEVNDRTRIYKDGTGAFEDIFRGISLVRDRKLSSGKNNSVGGGVIVVVSQANIDNLPEVYEFFKREKINFKLNALIMSGRATKDLGITPTKYSSAMNSLFDRWINDFSAGEIDPFSEILGNLMTGCPTGCNFSKSCRKGFVSVGPNGDVYPCGRFDGVEEFWMGNITEEKGLEKALNSEVQKKLSCRTKETVTGCSKCKFSNVCNSGCMHNAHTAGNVMGKDPYCPSYKRIFKHVSSFLHKELAQAEVRR